MQKSKVLMGGCTGEDLINGLRVRTLYKEDGYCFDEYDCEGDTGWLTYIDDHFGQNVVEYYDGEDEAVQGHYTWVKRVSDPKFKTVEVRSDKYDHNEREKTKLWRIGSDAALKEQLRRERAAVVAEKKRKLEHKRATMAAYKPIADAFKGFPFNKMHGEAGTLEYNESVDYLECSTKDSLEVKYVPHQRQSKFTFEIRDPKIIERYWSKIENLAAIGMIHVKHDSADDLGQRLSFEISVDPWTTQDWLKKGGSDYKLDGL